MNANRWSTAALVAAAFTILAGCGDGGSDSCDGVLCEAPAARCDGDVAVSYTGAGICTDGTCDYAAVTVQTDCAEGGQICSNGDCVDPAECADGADCTPPADFCDGQTAVTYAGNGTCQEGSCDYGAVETSEDCSAQSLVCVDGSCVEGEACTADADCDMPPADTCDGDTVMAYADTGTCSAQGLCEYTASAGEDCAASDLMCVEGACAECEVDTDCANPPDDACGADAVVTYPSGVCDAGSCTYEPVTEPCDTPPGPTCDGTLAQTFAETGTCAEPDVVCEYAEGDVVDCSEQGLACVDGVGCAQGCADDAECTAPPAPACEGDDAVTYATPGTCTATGACEYTETRETCADGCFAGACLDTGSAGIAAARAAPTGTSGLNIRVENVTVTYVTGNEEIEGFFVQSAPEGPGLWVDTEAIWTRHVGDFPDLVYPNPGDVISFTVDEMTSRNGVAGVADLVPASSFEVWETVGTADPGALVVDITDRTDIVSNFERYESRLVRISGTLNDVLRTAGPGFVQWPYQTDVMPPTPNHLLWRTSPWIVDNENLTEGCEVTGTVPMFGNVYQGDQYAWPTAFHASDYETITCPGPRVVAAQALSDTEVAVFFDRTVESSTVTADAFTVTGNTVTGASAGNRHVILTLGAPVGSGTVSVASSVTDTEGTPVLAAPNNRASFTPPGSSVGPDNGGFETWWVPDEPAIPANWSVASGLSIAQATTGVHSGAYAAQMTRADSGTPRMWSNRMPVVPGRTYRFGGWFMDDDATAAGRLVLEFQNRAQLRLAGHTGTASSDGAVWQQSVDAFTAPADAWWVQVGVEETGSAGGVVEVDDVTIVPGAAP